MNLSVVIPLWNEEKNIPILIAEILKSNFLESGITEVVLVNNGSGDRTGILIDEAARMNSLFKAIHLPKNLNYGGGILEGINHTINPIVGMIPGDLQVKISDLKAVWSEYKNQTKVFPKLLCKGNRITRLDPWHTRIVSFWYTRLACAILNISVKDINGLPKIFDKSLIAALPEEKMHTFVLDAQLLLFANLMKWPIHEVEVSFEARREGVSSWSGKRLQTYWASFKRLLILRDQRKIAPR